MGSGRTIKKTAPSTRAATDTKRASLRGAKASSSSGPKHGSGNKIRILLVDDHPIVRQGLAELISRQSDLIVCGEAGDGREALAFISKLRPDVAVIDVSLRDASGLDLIKTIKVQDPRVALLVLSMHDENLYAERALRAGAGGYIMKQEASHKILDGIRGVLKGEMVVSEPIKARLLQQLVHGQSASAGFSVERLSNRELEVFQLIGDGFATRQIARKLCLSVKTIETYREKLKEKLNLDTGAELLQQAIVWTKSNSVPAQQRRRPE